MSRTRTLAALTMAALFVATSLLSGCFLKPNTQVPPGASSGSGTATSESTQTSVEPTTTTTVDNTGPITTPAADSTERKALLDAARTKLGTSSQFYVYQLYVQGDTAIGDLDTLKTSDVGRVFVAWLKENGSWAAIGATRFGTASANEASTARALPSFSAELINKIDWKLPAPKVGGTSESDVKKSLSTDAKKWAKSAMSGEGTPYKVTTLKVAQDSAGRWWGYAVVQPTGDSNTSYEALEIWAKYSGSVWTGKIQDPEPPAPSTYFPSSVISKLGLE